MDKKLQELLDWMFFHTLRSEVPRSENLFWPKKFFRTLRSETIEILTNQLSPVQKDAIIEKLEALKKKKEEEKE